MNGEVTIYNLLKNNSTFSDKLSDVETDPENNPGVTFPALSIGVKEPDNWGIKDTTASIYIAVPVDKTIQHLETEITVACRAPSEPEVKSLAEAAENALNLVRTAEYQLYCSSLGVIAPQDENDAYNKPITVRILAVRELV